MAMRWVIRVRTLMQTNRRRMSSPSLCPFIRTTAKLNNGVPVFRTSAETTTYTTPYKTSNLQPTTFNLHPTTGTFLHYSYLALVHGIGGVGGVDEKVKDAVHADLRERALPHSVPGKNKKEVQEVWTRRCMVETNKCVCRVSVLGLGCASTEIECASECVSTSTLIKPTHMYGVGSMGFHNEVTQRTPRTDCRSRRACRRS